MLTKAEEKLLIALRRRKFRETERLFLAEGVRVVEELLACGIDLRLALSAPSLEDTDRGRLLAGRLEQTGALRRVGEGVLNRLAGTDTPQGVLAVGTIPSADLDTLSPGATSVGVVLDGLQDPGNLGAVARTADAFGLAFIAALPGTVDTWNPKAVRSAAGSLFRVPVIQTGTAPLLHWLKAERFAILGADVEGVPVDDLESPPRVALVLGNEGAGLSPEVRAAVDGLVAVPIRGGAESLNVGVAAGVLLYLLTRSR